MITATFGAFLTSCGDTAAITITEKAKQKDLEAKIYAKTISDRANTSAWLVILSEIIIGITLVILGALAYHGILFNTTAALPLMIAGTLSVSPILPVISMLVSVCGNSAGETYAKGYLEKR